MSKLQRKKLVFHTTLILLENLCGNGGRQIRAAEQQIVEIAEACRHNGTNVCRQIAETTFLIEPPLIIGIGYAATRAGANPNSSLKSHWRRHGWMHNYDCDLMTFQGAFLSIKRRKRVYVSVATHGGEVLEQLIGNRRSCRLTIVCYADKQHANLPMIRQIVGKCAYSLTEFIAIRGRFRSLHAVRFRIIEQLLKVCVSHNNSPKYGDSCS